MPGILTAASVSLVPGGGGSWVPTDNASLKAWYQGQSLGLSDGANVTVFPDSVAGNVYQLSTAGTNPIYKTAQQNGRGIVRFTGQMLELGGFTASTYPYTIGFVVKVPSIVTGGSLMGASIPGFDWSLGINNGILTMADTGNGVMLSASTTITANIFQRFILKLTSTTCEMFIDGVSAGSGSHAVTLTAGRTLIMASRMFGSSSNNAITYDVGECCIFNTAFAGGDITNLDTYFKTGWGL